MRTFTFPNQFPSTSNHRKSLDLIERKKQKLLEDPTALGQSDLYWKSRVGDRILRSPQTIWERNQHDELKEKEEND